MQHTAATSLLSALRLGRVFMWRCQRTDLSCWMCCCLPVKQVSNVASLSVAAWLQCVFPHVALPGEVSIMLDVLPPLVMHNQGELDTFPEQRVENLGWLSVLAMGRYASSEQEQPPIPFLSPSVQGRSPIVPDASRYLDLVESFTVLVIKCKAMLKVASQYQVRF